MNKKLIRKMLTAAGGPIYEEDWSDRWEPYAAKIGLAGDVVGLGTAATGVGIPVGTAIAGFANIPNLIIDGYQTARDTWRSFNDGGNSLGSAAWNGGEFLLDAAGLKALQYINKAQRAGVKAEQVISSMERKATHPYKRVGTGASRSRLRKSAESKRSYNAGRNKALEESTNTLAKKGVRETQGEYFRRKLADEMAKRGYGVAVNDAIKSANRTLRQNLGIISGVSGGTNVYHLLPKHKSGGQVRKMQTASGGPINWLRKRIYTNIEPFGYNDVGSRLYNGIILNKNEHSNFKGDYSDAERAPALYLTVDNIWGEYLHIPEKERRYSNGKYKIKNNGNGTFSLPFKSMEDIMLTVNSNNPLLWGLRGKAINSVVGEYDIYRGYDKKGDYLKYIDHWRINPYDVKEDKEYGLDNNSLLKRYFKGKDDASFGLGTPVEIQGKYYLDDIYNIKGKDRGGHYLPEVIVTGKKKQGGKMNILEFLKNGSGIHIKKKNRGKFTSYCGGKVTDECILKGKNSSNPAIRKRATFADNARHFKHRLGGSIVKLQLGDYFKWNNLSREDKVKRNKQIAKLYLDKGPSILNYYNALKAYFGGFNPKNPYLITGEAPSPGWGKQGVTGLHKMMAKLPEAKLTLLAPLAGRSRAATIIKDKNIVEALKHRDEVYRRWASLYKQKHDPTPTTFRTKPAKIKRQETNVANSNAKTLAGGKGNAGGSYSSKSHTIRVTTSNKTSAENLEDIAFHEGIHSYGLGESPSYVWKSKYLNFPEGTNPYFLDPREIATHGIQQGQNLGIKVGQTYPGREAMIKMIENRPEGLGFGGVPMILYNNAKTNSDYRRLWSLLNGTFKDGGVIIAANARKWKHKEGGSIEKLEKGSWIKNSLSFLNESGLGKTLVEGGLSFLLSSSQNKSIAGATDVAKAELDKEKQEASDYALLMATKKALEMLLIDPNNPNAFGGSIVLNYIRLQLYNEYLNSINLDIANRKALLDMLSLQMLSENTSGAISGIIQSGLGVVGNLLGGKKNNSSSISVPSSTTITGTPSSSKLVVTTKSGMSGTVDLWRKAMQV